MKIFGAYGLEFWYAYEWIALSVFLLFCQGIASGV